MKRLWSALAGLLAAIGFYGCDAVSLKELKPETLTGYEVRDRMGAPTMEWQNIDGTLTWEFSRQPEGVVTYMVVIGPDNILREIRQVITEENFARVQNGMSREDIRRLLGKPGSIGRLDLKNEEVWDWRYETDPTRKSYFSVHFDAQGKVARTSRNDKYFGG